LKRAHSDESENAVKVVRAFFGYIWLIVFFGCVILLVQASLEEKRIRYRMGEQNIRKIGLLDEIRRCDNRIKELENFNRIAMLTETQLPQLGVPKKPAIELTVPGLRNRTGFPKAVKPIPRDRGFLRGLRDRWRHIENETRQWMRELVN